MCVLGAGGVGGGGAEGGGGGWGRKAKYLIFACYMYLVTVIYFQNIKQNKYINKIKKIGYIFFKT